MHSIIGVLCLTGIVSLTSAQTKVKCFDHNKSRDKTGILLDCSHTGNKYHPYTIEEWIKYHAFYDDGFIANRVMQINLENNNFQKLFTLPSMTSLKKLSFKYNNISIIENKAFSFLPALEELDLSYNSLNSHDLRQSVFRVHQQPNIQISNEESTIRILKLGHNNIHSLSPDCFEYLTKLELLDLDNNPLKVIDQNTEVALGHLKNLQHLDLSSTDLSEFPRGVFTHFHCTHTLYLNGNRFQQIPDEIRSLPLAYLNMNANPISHLDNESFVGLDKLQQLIISSMPKLTDIGSGTFAPLTKLVILQMSHNPSLSYIHHDAFRDEFAKSHWSLRQFHLSNNNLSSIDANLYPWSKLDLFDANSNPWNCDCRLTWLATYINVSFIEMPETLLYYRCNEPKDLDSTLVSQLNYHIDCDELNQSSTIHSHGHVTRLRHFVIVLGLVISIFVVGALVNKGFREIKKIFKPRICVPARFSTGVKYRPADFEECTDTFEVPPTHATINGRSPIVINSAD